ncbi:NAD(P)/FAD-dependent oxidoreductase [Octadecabacter sp. 1_MG-2023]|uniref:NAD(P)/FAD-dependent oxidoreductase n=1 Tax=unclassified Octadecabacter TaxID=196158 RepID=UPI001C0A4F42|nr:MULTISPECIES: NAD(P)/FAD-dependent oxidoreductase [unclassified Octadecabacter]MBU2992929.1 NAD(P)/FAD-dependent oxidoreductase [Octadecabacter sp. B2R22]MDO6733620.1 NAD(P)/FAD-dependent oxidoreductase [Octadecabacter sp. 1_MG-2023]
MQVNTLILGAGAAGLHCAAHAGPQTLVIDHAKAAGEKIRISGGGRCNFTNLGTTHANFISQNPHFAKSALARYTQWDFIELVDRHGIAWHEKTLGQLFCDDSAKDIIAMLLAEMAPNAKLWLNTTIGNIRHDGKVFHVALKRKGEVHTVQAKSLVVATGGKSIPKMGATGIAYDIATQFGLSMSETRAALVPFTFSDEKFKPLAGVAAPARVITTDGTSFDEALLFTHRGLSGPAVLQASSYWREGEDITVALSPDIDLATALKTDRTQEGRKALSTTLAKYLPSRLIDFLSADLTLSGNTGDLSDARIDELTAALRNWSLKPSGTEGYRTAEVTLGGVDTNGLSSKTMEAKAHPNLYFIGEAVDVTGWLGGYNFQWAWSSGYAAGTAIAQNS